MKKDQLTAGLHSSEPSEVLEAIKFILKGKMGSFSNDLLSLMASTDSAKIRNATALALKDLRSDGLVSSVAEIVKNGALWEECGTLIYALSERDCSSVVPFLVDVVVLGSWEASQEAFNVLCSIEQPVCGEDIDAAYEKLVSALVHVKDQDRAGLIKELLDMFED